MPPRTSSCVPSGSNDNTAASPLAGISVRHEYATRSYKERESTLSTYLDSFLSADYSDDKNGNRYWKNRVECCGSSRSLYCSQCCRLLVEPQSLWPASVQNGTLQLPFELHLILDDRRKSATGLHAVTLLQASWGMRRKAKQQQQQEKRNVTSKNDDNQAVAFGRRKITLHSSDDEYDADDDVNKKVACGNDSTHRLPDTTIPISSDNNNAASEDDDHDDSRKNKNSKANDGSSNQPYHHHHPHDCSDSKPPVTLIDFECGDPIPIYGKSNKEGEESTSSPTDEQGMTCILFPSPGESMPLASVSSNITRLVVLDCKWSNTSCKDHPELVKLQKVHLTSPPQKSHYWRWHNSGSGMLSTIEAVYFAALEVVEHRKINDKTNNNNNNNNDDGWDGTDAIESRVIDIMWLFALQRVAICHASPTSKNGTDLPFTDEGKEARRALRRCAGTERQVRDKLKGKKLREEGAAERRLQVRSAREDELVSMHNIP